MEDIEHFALLMDVSAEPRKKEFVLGTVQREIFANIKVVKTESSTTAFVVDMEPDRKLVI